jgi:hypothetical protein
MARGIHDSHTGANLMAMQSPGSALFGLYFGTLVWGGLYLRDERLRALIPVSGT